MRETFNIFFKGNQLLNVVVLAGGCGEDWVVDDDSVDGRVDIRSKDCFFDFFFIDFPEIKLEATTN